MRILLRVALGLVVLLVVAVVGLALSLPRLIQSDAVRARISQAARDATGREVGYAALGAGVIPPRLTVTQVSVAGETERAAPMLEGADVELRLALLPLLARAVVVDSLVIEQATLRLVRSAEGIELPTPKSQPAAGAAGDAAAEAGGADAEEGAFALAVRRVRVRDTHVILEDRAVSPAVTWDVRDLDANLSGDSLDDPIDFDVSASLGSGGSLKLSGRAQRDADFTLKLRLDDFVLEPTRPYLPPEQQVKGSVSGSIEVGGVGLEPRAVLLDLELSGAELRVDEVAMSGKLSLKADVKGSLEQPKGTFSIDATEAALRYGESFSKPPGTPATAEGRIVTTPEGNIGVDGTKLRIRNVDATVSADTGKRSRVRLDAPPFALEGWEALLPALAESPLAGRVGLDGLELATEPLEARGRITLDGVQLQSEKGEPMLLRGAVRAEGDSVVGDELVAEVAGQSVPLDLRIANLASKPRLSVRTKVEDADTNQLMTIFAKKPDTLSGPLDLDVDVAASLGGEGSVADSLTGTVRFEILPGQIQGVSLLRSSLEQLGSLGEAALLAGRIKGGRSLQRFYGDEFESLSATLRLGGGSVRTDDLRIVYDNYTVDLRGSVVLATLGLDLTGQLSIDEKVDAALAGEAGGGQDPAALDAGGARTGKRRVLPLARVGGTLDAPRVVLNAAAVRSFALQYAVLRETDKLDKYKGKIDEHLGEGTGEQVLDALEGLLGGGRRRQ